MKIYKVVIENIVECPDDGAPTAEEFKKDLNDILDHGLGPTTNAYLHLGMNIYASKIEVERYPS